MTPRPTCEQVDAALTYADTRRVRDKYVVILAAEVRALRAELAEIHDAIRPRTDPSMPQRRDDPEEIRARIAALETRTPQPAEPIDLAGWSTTVTLPLAGGTPPAVVVPAGWVTIPDAAPQPAVPDGEGDGTGRCDWCWSNVPLTADGYMHEHTQSDGSDCPGSHDTTFGGPARRGAVPDGEGVPARLDANDSPAAAETRGALALAWCAWCAEPASSPAVDCPTPWRHADRIARILAARPDVLALLAPSSIEGAESVVTRLRAAGDAASQMRGGGHVAGLLWPSGDALDSASPEVRAAVAAALARTPGAAGE